MGLALMKLGKASALAASLPNLGKRRTDRRDASRSVRRRLMSIAQHSTYLALPISAMTVQSGHIRDQSTTR